MNYVRIGAIVTVLFLSGCVARVQNAGAAVGFHAATGPYSVTFSVRAGAILISRNGSGLAIHELPGGKKVNLLTSVRTIRHSGDTWTLSGKARWADFSVAVSLPAADPGLVALTVRVHPLRDVPPSSYSTPDVTLQHAPASALITYATAPPVAGNNLYLADKAMDSTVLYASDYTSLGTYFDRTNSGPTQANFPYPNAGEKGALVGVAGSSFGYIPPPTSLQNLPMGKTTTVVRSFLYLLPGIPADETSTADTYLRMLDTVLNQSAKPAIPAANWAAYAAEAANDLANQANLVTVGGHTYLRSYVSDTRSSPELITQAGVLAGLRAYENRNHVQVPLAATLEDNLPTFYDPVYHTITNGLPHDPNAHGESWYYVDNMISLLQLAQLGDPEARTLLLNSLGSLIELAHANKYVFPETFQYGVWQGGQSVPEVDVAGGYAWLMLGVDDLMGGSQYLPEAEAAMKVIPGRGFGLSYETHMTAYTAAAAERLYALTGDAGYGGDAGLALANLFHATRLWDCTYGACRKGSGYHTYMGLNPLPWSDYIAMLEQYEAWLALRDFQQHAQHLPSYVQDLVQAFVTFTPLTMQYSLPTRLPPGAASSAAGEYPFVPHNVLSWDIPLEDLREGEVTSGSIGQEIYGAGGVFQFAGS